MHGGVPLLPLCAFVSWARPSLFYTVVSFVCVCVGTCACVYRVGVAIMPQTCLQEVPCANHGFFRVSLTGYS
jgi:hypothetical protein